MSDPSPPTRSRTLRLPDGRSYAGEDVDRSPAAIGRYEIRGVLGQGGMGVVHLGWDDRLQRLVAVKRVTPWLSSDPDRLAALEREARTLASLNHPNIATAFSLERDDDGVPFLTLEYVEGETLRDLLERGPLTPARALVVGDAIATALETAHERGIVHRDLKPGNVMVLPSGHVKVLDFGLAAVARSGPDEPSGAPAAVGTPGYMSPEQARGEPESPLTDVFAFGCVLYECLTGRRAFPGDADERIRALLEEDPDLAPLPSEPPGVREIVAGCLEKDPPRRTPGISEVIIALRRSLGLDPSGLSRRRAALDEIPHNLPHELTSFVGRERELTECVDALSQARLLTLTGLGGSGKSRLARAIARKAPHRFPDGLCWAELAPHTNADQVPAVVAAACGVAERPGRPLLDELFHELESRTMLLVLDNCEHLRDACAGLVTGLLRACPRVVVLATSRERLSVPGETVFAIPPLAVPAASVEPSAENVGNVESVRLFVERARLAQPKFALDDETAPAVARICRRLEGIPLALELAASRAQLLSPEEIDARLEKRFQVLRGGVTDGPAHHATLRGTLDWSFELLDDRLLRLAQGLAVFHGGWTLEAAAAVCSLEELDLLDDLGALADKSLVEWTGGARGVSRYRMLETVREYAAARLAESGEGHETVRRHAEWFAGWTERAARKLHSADAAGWRLRIEQDHENILAALEWAARAEDEGDLGLRIAGAAAWFWYMSGRLAMGRSRLERALAAAPDPSPERAVALDGLALLAWAQGDSATARRSLEETLADARRRGELRKVAQGLVNLGSILYDEGEYESAGAKYRESLEMFEREGDEPAVAAALSNLSLVAYARGERDEARTLMERSLAIRRKHGDRLGTIIALTQLGQIATLARRWSEASAHFVECLRLLLELGDRSQAHQALQALAQLVTARAGNASDLRHAAELLGAADAVRESIGAGLPEIARKEHEELLSELDARLGAALSAARAEGGGRSLAETLEAAIRAEEGDSAGSA